MKKETAIALQLQLTALVSCLERKQLLKREELVDECMNLISSVQKTDPDLETDWEEVLRIVEGDA